MGPGLLLISRVPIDTFVSFTVLCWKYLTAGLGQGEIPGLNICQFLWHKYDHHIWFQAIILNEEFLYEVSESKVVKKYT